MKGNEMENREKIAEWIRNPEMEATWGSKTHWYTAEEYIEDYSVNIKGMINFEIRKRQTPIDAFMEELSSSGFNHEPQGWVGWVISLERARELAEKHFGAK